VIGCNPIGIPFQRPEILKKYPSMVYKAISRLANKKDSTILKKMLTDVGKVLLKNPLTPIVTTITQCLCEDEQILKGISVPVTILWAKEDELLPISYMERLQLLVPHIRIQYIEGHHNWCLVDQPYTLRLILGLCSELKLHLSFGY
jgi:pimeloyl-ACP methyl ester carboxylesterase